MKISMVAIAAFIVNSDGSLITNTWTGGAGSWDSSGCSNWNLKICPSSNMQTVVTNVITFEDDNTYSEKP
jgi:hypothetical protein